MLLGMIPETDPKHALLQKMQRQTDRATNIVGNLLNFSRTGNIVESVEIDVNKLLDDTLQLLEPQLRKSNVEIVKNYTDLPPRIFGNSGKLQQVFTNLVLNARDAMISGGRITLVTAVSDGEVNVEVSDTGEGISEENLKQDLRSVLHNERRRQRNRIGISGELRNRPGTRRHDRGPKRGRPRNNLQTFISRDVETTSTRG